MRYNRIDKLIIYDNVIKVSLLTPCQTLQNYFKQSPNHFKVFRCFVIRNVINSLYHSLDQFEVQLHDCSTSLQPLQFERLVYYIVMLTTDRESESMQDTIKKGQCPSDVQLVVCGLFGSKELSRFFCAGSKVGCARYAVANQSLY